MAKRFYSSLIDLRNQTFTIEIWDTAFAGTASTFNPGADGFSQSYKGDSNQRTGTILATECSVQFRIETADHETFLTDIIGSKEGRFTMKITKGTGTPTLHWVGLILTDVGGYEEADRPFFTLRAVDGLGLLKNVPYKDGTNFYNGRETLKQQLINALNQITYVDTHFATTERFLRVAVDWWEDTMTNNTTNDPLALTWVDQAVWFVYKKNIQEARSCREVIDNIMRCFGAQITMFEGVFWVHQITYRTASTIVLRSYDKAGTYLSSNNFSNQNTINQTTAGALFTGGVYEFFPPLSEARHTFNVKLHQNLLAGQSFSSGVTSNVTINRAVEANSGATTLRLTGNITLSIFNQTYSGNATQPGFAIFKCQLKIGSRYLKRLYTYQNYQVIFGTMTWETSASYFYLAVSMPNGVPASGSGNTYNYNQVQDLTTPPLPSGAESFEFGMIWDTITVGNLTDYLKSFNFLNQWLEPYSYGNPALNDDAWEYVSENPDAENTEVHETECLIGNSTDPNATGSLWVKPAGSYVLAGDWGDGTDPTDKVLEKLNVELVVGGQQKPIRRLSGTLYGTNFNIMGRVLWEGATWLLLGGTYNAAGAQMSGEWFELDYDGAGLSTSGPIKIKIPGGDYPEVPDFPGSSGTSGKAAYELPTAGPGTLLYPVAATKTLTNIAAGAITNVDITDILAAGDFYDGDTIVILNPVTGAFDELEVTVTSAGGDDFITVTGTLTSDYPPESPIIKKPIIGHPQVFGAGLANRLTYWVSENELNDLAAGTTGQLLQSNGTGSPPSWVTAGGAGTVTSVGLSLPGIFTVSGSPVTTSGTLTGTLATQAANSVFAGPTSGGAATPTFRALVAGDIPAVNASAVTGLTANRVLYGSGGGGIAQSANFTFDGTDAALGAGGLNVFKNTVGNSQNANKVTIGSVVGSENYPGIWFGSAAISLSNYAFLADVGASQTILNAPSTGNISMRVNNSELARLTTTGLGVGVTAAEKLHVEGNVRFSGALMPNNAAGSTGQVLTSAGAGAPPTWTAAGTGTVTSVALTMPTGFSVAGSPVTSSGTLAVTTTLNGPLRGNGSGFTTGNTSLSSEVTGTLPVANGGTGLSALGTTGQLIRVNGAGTALEYFTPTYLTANQTITLSGDVTGSGSTAITTTIATNAVSNAKFRQGAARSVVGVTGNATANVADIQGTANQVLRVDSAGTGLAFGAVNLASSAAVTGNLPVTNLNSGTGASSTTFWRGDGTWATPASSGIGGTLVATRIPFALNTNTLTDDGAMTWDNTNKRFLVGSGTTNAYINAGTTTALTTATEFLRTTASNTSNNIVGFYNTNNANTNANILVGITVGGTAGGDPVLQFTVSGAVTHAVGIDNSDIDKFKITPGQALPGGVANRGLIITNAATALVGINRDSPTQPLDVAGLARVRGLVGESGTPTVAFGTGAGTGPTNNSLLGGSVFLDFTFTTGTAPTANGVIFTVTVPFTMPAGICPVWSPGNAQTATDIAKFYRSGGSTTTFSLQANGTLAASTQYRLFFIIASTS